MTNSVTFPSFPASNRSLGCWRWEMGGIERAVRAWSASSRSQHVALDDANEAATFANIAADAGAGHRAGSGGRAWVVRRGTELRLSAFIRWERVRASSYNGSYAFIQSHSQLRGSLPQ
jgi:hypothetical protein